jgi:prepilin-type N-terminal cleavage/methylation domain-containing protein/prepilin-type processing-associated H-X9-DG protein
MKIKGLDKWQGGASWDGAQNAGEIRQCAKEQTTIAPLNAARTAVAAPLAQSAVPARGFTLIELLVVIAIIAILAAILLPVLQSAQMRAKEAQCLNNLKEIDEAALIYYDEYNTWVGPMNNNPSSSQGDWMGAMISYYKGTNVLYCPLAPFKNPPTLNQNENGKADTAWIWALSSPNYSSSYGINKWLETAAMAPGMGNTGAHPTDIYPTQTSVRQPTMVPMFMDAAWINLDPWDNDPPAYNLYDPLNGTSPTAGSAANEGMPRCCVARHGGRGPGSAPRNVATGVPLPGMINMGFVDGHVEEVKLENLWSFYWHLNWTPHATPPPWP